MESGKQGTMSPETSSEENNDRSEAQANRENDTQTTTKRSYECTYCKRGFTNAQALGGHMNIHRKDRAKAKQHSPVYQNDQEVSNFMANSPHFSSPSWYHPVDYNNYVSHNNHHNMYFQVQPCESIASDFPYSYSNNEIIPSQSSLAISNDDLMGADLTLQIDSTRCLDGDDHDEARPGLINDEVLDLELRLGHRY